jgi:hypothetical protein
LVKKVSLLVLGLMALTSIIWSTSSGSTAAAADAPLAVTPYNGFDPLLARAPYVTDLTQTSAYVNWATTSQSPGSLQFAETSGGSCPSSVTTWTAGATPVKTSLPGPVNPVQAGPSASITGWAYSVTDGSGTTTQEYQASVQLTGLSSGTEYCYAVFSTDSAGATDLLPASESTQSFSTLDAVSTSSTKSLTFDVTADTGENYSFTSQNQANDVAFPGEVNPDQASIDNQIGQSGAKFLLVAGDIGYSGGNQSTYGDLEHVGTTPEVSNVFGPSYFPQTGGIPTFAADGNHGQNSTTLRIWPTADTAAASGGTYSYDSYPESSSVDGLTGNFPDNWYAFSTGNVRIYVIDGAWADGSDGTTNGALCPINPSYCQAYQADADEHWRTSSPEYQWLQHDLAGHPGGVKFAVFHYPLRSDNATQPSDPYLLNSSANPNASTSLEALLSANGVDIAFNGHTHTYQRIIPHQPGQVINYVAGGGGGVLEPVQAGQTCTNMLATASVYALGWSPSKTDPDAGVGSACGGTTPSSAADVYSFLKVTVTGNTVVVTPTNAAGQTFDRKTYNFGAPTNPSTPPPNPVTNPGPPTPPSAPSAPGLPASSACVAHLAAGSVVGTAVAVGGTGYLEVDAAGDVAAFGSAQCSGSMTGIPLNQPVVGMAVDQTTGGYWLVAKDGGIFSFNAPFLGSTGGTHLNRPIVGIATNGSGYWLVASDGGIFAYGAPFYGSTGATTLNRPIVGMGLDASTGGYWLVASDGGVFSFNAPFYGSTGNITLNKPVVGIMPLADGSGYRLVATDGGVFDYNAPFYGSTGNVTLNLPVIGGLSSAPTGGYWLFASDGGVFSYHAPFFGSAAG